MYTDPYAYRNTFVPPSKPASGPVGALLSFPFIVLTAYCWPTPTTFARQKSDPVGSNMLVCLGLLLVTGLYASLWGRLPSLRNGIATLSFGRLLPQPLSAVQILFLAFVTPGLILAFAGILHWLAHMQGGQGKYRAQLYSVLVIATPPILLVSIMLLLLSVLPDVALLIRVPFISAALLLFIYSLFLHVPALMGVQQLKAWQAVFCMAVIVVVVLLVFLIPDMFSDSHDNHGGGGDSHSTRPRNRKARFCPYCGFSLEVYDQLHTTSTQTCPKCGKSLTSF